MLKYSTATLLLSMATVSYAAPVDWTPFLDSMQYNCDASTITAILPVDPQTESVTPKIPKKLKSSVISISPEYDGAVAEVTLNLKNATAFGQPLKVLKVGYGMVEGGLSVQMKFANQDFMKLLPSFFAGNVDHVEHAGTKKYWVSEIRNVPQYDSNGVWLDSEDEVLKTYQSTFYKKNAGREMRVAYWAAKSDSPDFYDSFRRELKKRGFYTQQKTIYNQLIKSRFFKDEDVGIKTYMTNGTGYEIEDDDMIELEFIKSNKTISCTAIPRQEVFL